MPYYPDSYKRLEEGQVDSILTKMGFKLVSEKSNPLHSSPFFLRETMQLEKLGCEFVEETIASVYSIRSSESSIHLDLKQSEKTESELPKQEDTIDVAQPKPRLFSLPPLVLPARMRAMSDYSRQSTLVLSGLKRYRLEYLTATSTRKEDVKDGPEVVERLKSSVLPRVRMSGFSGS